MIWKPEHYLFVEGMDPDDLHPHGDLDRILMNGKIMPTVPASEQPFKIRGEDVAFLMEAVGEREALSLNVYPPPSPARHQFTRYRSADQIRRIINRIKDLYGSFGVHGSLGEGWLKPGEEWPENIHSSVYNEVTPYFALADKILHEDDMTSDSNAFRRHSRFDAKEFWRIFKDVAAMDTAILGQSISEYTPDFSVGSSFEEIYNYYTISGTHPGTSVRNPAGTIYHRILSGSWRDDGDMEHADYHLVLKYDQTANLKNFELSWSANSINYLSGKSGEMEMWAMFQMYDADSRRTGDQSFSSYALVKLLAIPEGAIRDGAMHFPTRYLTSLSDRLLSMARSDCPCSGDFPPFVDRTADAYRPDHGSAYFNHEITITPMYVFLQARIRDRTRWNS